jgi:hypothetical protein
MPSRSTDACVPATPLHIGDRTLDRKCCTLYRLLPLYRSPFCRPILRPVAHPHEGRPTPPHSGHGHVV